MKRLFLFFTMIMCFIMASCSLVSCYEYSDELIISSCGSGFYINRDNKFNYYIDALDYESNGNSFYFSDYFCSEEYGVPYAISDGIKNMGNVFLAKKSDYYNSNIYDFNLDSYPNCCIEITSEMNYVNIHSSNPEIARELFIVVKPRELPLDVTFENVNICTKSAIPVFYSQTSVDINLNLIGQNTFTAGSISQRSTSVWSTLENGLTKMEDSFVSICKSVPGYIEDIANDISNQNTIDILINSFDQIGSVSIDAFEYVVKGMQNFVMGSDGQTGRDGSVCFIHAGGICLVGDGVLSIVGGSGEDGLDAKDSAFGYADGGDGGAGGDGIVCQKFMSVSSSEIFAHGGKGGEGGDPSEGLWGLVGSSGDKGAAGRDGRSFIVAEPREE